MNAAKDDADETAFPAELLEQLTKEAHVVAAGDQTEDVALDLYETPFSPAARQRALRWLESDEYATAASKYQNLRADAGTELGSQEAS